MVRRGRLIAVVTFLLGCAVLLGGGCAGTSSEAPEERGHTEATKQEQTRSAKAASEEARCEGTQTTKDPEPGSGFGVYTTNDLPGCPNGGLLLGTDKSDKLAGNDGDDEIRALGGPDSIYGGDDKDIIYAGPGDDILPSGLYRYEGADDDVIYGGSGDDELDEGGNGADVIYGGDGNDFIGWLTDDKRPDKLYCGKGKDHVLADKNDFVSSSCEKKEYKIGPPPPSG